MIRRVAFLDEEAMRLAHYAAQSKRFASETSAVADFDASLSQIDASSSDNMPAMRHRWLEIVGAFLVVGAVLPISVAFQTWPQTERNSTSPDKTTDKRYARIAILRPHDGDTVDFEAGYIRHLEFHRQAKDAWVWYGWTIWAGERQRWFVYATFGHSATSLDNPVPPGEDERDNVANVTPHAQFAGNAVYEYLPALSRGSGVPTPVPRLEFTTVDLNAGAERAFEVALSGSQSTLHDETLWYRMVAGGPAPRYVRLRPRPSLSAILDGSSEQPLADKIKHLIVGTTVEILTLRPTMSYGLSPARE
jgi:hypothetical protein